MFDYEAVFKTELFVGLLDRELCEALDTPNIGSRATIETKLTATHACELPSEETLAKASKIFYEKIKEALANDKNTIVEGTTFSHYNYVRQTSERNLKVGDKLICRPEGSHETMFSIRGVVKEVKDDRVTISRTMNFGRVPMGDLTLPEKEIMEFYSLME